MLKAEDYDLLVQSGALPIMVACSQCGGWAFYEDDPHRSYICGNKECRHAVAVEYEVCRRLGKSYDGQEGEEFQAASDELTGLLADLHYLEKLDYAEN